jgi:hypothetical protein
MQCDDVVVQEEDFINEGCGYELVLKDGDAGFDRELVLGVDWH